MINMKNMFMRAMLALSILVAAPAALAGPVYRVSLNTSAWTGQSGYLDLTYGGLIGSATGTAVASNFAGDFDDSIDVYYENGASGTRASGFTLVSGSAIAYLSQAVNFGGIFSFDLRFDTLAQGLAADFGVNLTDSDFLTLDGFTGFSFTLLEGESTPQPVVPGTGTGVIAVPEPSDWLLVATGLFLLAATRRYQRG